MQPKDWSRIEKLLENIADKETLDAVKKAAETIETSLTRELTANVVKSIQRGVITLGASKKTATATINDVNTQKATVHYLGDSYSGNGSMAYVELTDSTTVTANTLYSPPSGYSTKVSFEVVEYY